LIRMKSRTAPLVPHIFVVMAGDAAVTGGMQLAERLRRNVAGLRVQCNLGGGSFKAQFKRADRSGAKLALVLGEDELRNSTVTVKHLRGEGGQETRPLNDLESWLSNWLREES